MSPFFSVMKFVAICLIFIFSYLGCEGQNKKYKKEINKTQAKGLYLYHSEKTSWVGTDLMLKDYKDLLPLTGGYFSMVDKKSSTFILFSRDEKPSCLLEIKFDLKENFKITSIDTTRRALNKTELEYHTIRQLAVNRLYDGPRNGYVDSTFIVPKNSNPNFIPYFNGKQRSVYILAASSTGKKCFFGGDYRLDFDKNNKITSITSLHKKITSYPVNDPTFLLEKESVNHYHHEGDSDFITETDICTALLYKDLVGWKYFMVGSKKLAIVFDCETIYLTVIEQ